ncbi:MAG TPA: class I SAM-dependent methyltransferase [Thermoanaerobaculia bacterium]|nr:class I SAM-dependent methyltransferase [Thermoanaerobaculia bacterium]
MSAIARMVMRNFYRRAAGDPKRLPWHRDTPPDILAEAVAARNGRGRALDVGCGAGVYTTWLAEQGMEATGLDLFPEALEMARARAAAKNVNVTFVAGDLFAFVPDRPFELVFDSGCLHSLVGGNVREYKRKLLTWLAVEGDYVLGHWGKRHPLDWRPIGPKRRSQAAVEAMFAPELRLLKADVTDFAAPMPFGPMVRAVGYWFRRER